MTRDIKSLQPITQTPAGWAAKTDVIRYAERQAQSCEYLLKQFAKIKNPEVQELFAYLGDIHTRQFQDLAAVTQIPKDDNRRSFYFDELYNNFGLSTEMRDSVDTKELQIILAIQLVSYLRGHDRYRILKDYPGKTNIPFQHVWRKFYRDAITNAQKVLKCMDKNYARSANRATILSVLVKEDVLIRLIWRKNHVETT